MKKHISPIIFNILLFSAIALFAFKSGEPEKNNYYIAYQTENGVSSCIIEVNGVVTNGNDIDILKGIIVDRYKFEKVVIQNIIHLPID